MQCLYIISQNQRLIYSKTKFYLEKDNSKQMVASLPCSMFTRILSFTKVGERFARTRVRCCERLSQGFYIIALLHKVWVLDVEKHRLIQIHDSSENFSTPLNFCSDGTYVFWGDYGDNAKREAVNVYRLKSDLSVEVVYSFPIGSIRHIHNIIWDNSHCRFYILTGDVEKDSGIYMTDKDWKTVEPVMTGSQQYRAVVAFPYKEGLIYATDSVEESNNIYILQGKEIKVLTPFPGSCIYGTETENYYVFSSTVEPPEGRSFFNMFTYKLGAGIKDRYAHLIAVRKKDLCVKEVLKVRKDILPMKLFLYGALTFPKGQIDGDNLWFNIVACKGDGKTIMKRL